MTLPRRSLLLAALPAQAGTWRVRVPREPKGDEGRRDYTNRLLLLALQAQGHQPELVPSQAPMNQARSLRELALPQSEIDLCWTMTARALESQFLPVRVPLFKGLYGWRALLVRRGESERFAEVRSLRDLAAFRLGQGSHWPDSAVLRHNGLKVRGRGLYNDLLTDLAQGRSDAFPRSVAEIGYELASNADRFELEPALLLHYPTAMYFFVHPSQPALARELEAGLARLHANGVFEAEFRRVVAPRLSALGLARRHVLNLENPELPVETPLGKKGWWFRPV
jgi:Bacterial extracellular solute-binding proteins, family 3